MPGTAKKTRRSAASKKTPRKKIVARKKTATGGKAAVAKKPRAPRKKAVAAEEPAPPAQPEDGFVILLDPPGKADAATAGEDDGFVVLLDPPTPQAPPPGTVRLDAECTLAQLDGVHASLLTLLEHGDGPVTVDVGAVGVHDGAFVQLLCAFERSARAASLDVRYVGDTGALAATAQALGLQSYLSF